ncbi:hypothetical protein NP493_22g02008 [Ridgeia piscesae]|uniref:Uncharacterized protein n=1 Tax=Ridgeia piscesae TaxID=27915 RepID=A0AAD9PDR1_RIDPI|nr:hypothetical protein NP493_22g02008 [Ridgeia piscesae]
MGLSLCDSWEWREGRLLSYELILKFLIKNHWVYTFGASHLVSMASGKEANTLDTTSVTQGSLSAREYLKPTSTSDMGHSLPLPHIVISADSVKQDPGTASGSEVSSLSCDPTSQLIEVSV